MQSGPTKALVQIHWCWPWLSLMQAPSFSQGFGRQGSISVKRRNRGLWNLNFWWSPKLQPSHIKICPSEGLNLNHDNDYCWWWNETEENKTPQNKKDNTLSAAYAYDERHPWFATFAEFSNSSSGAVTCKTICCCLTSSSIFTGVWVTRVYSCNDEKESRGRALKKI